MQPARQRLPKLKHTPQLTPVSLSPNSTRPGKNRGIFPRRKTCCLRPACCSFQVAGTSKVQATNGLRGSFHLIPHGPEKTAESCPDTELVVCAWLAAPCTPAPEQSENERGER